MTIKELLLDYGTNQTSIVKEFKISKGLVSRWANISIPAEKYDKIRQFLKKRALDFISKY